MLNIFDTIPKVFARRYNRKLAILMTKGSKSFAEALGDIIGITRQTISNWELEETAPNPEQLKLLSKAFNVSIDDLLNNDIQNIIVKKVSDTEIVVNAIMKVLKVIGIAFVVFVIIIAIAALVIVFME